MNRYCYEITSEKGITKSLQYLLSTIRFVLAVSLYRFETSVRFRALKKTVINNGRCQKSIVCQLSRFELNPVIAVISGALSVGHLYS